MKRAAMGILVVLSAAVAWGGCERPASDKKESPTAAESGQQIVAYVSGVPISAADLETSAKNQLQKLQVQIYQVKRSVLDGMIEKMLIEKAAKDQGMSTEAYMAENVDAKVTPPTDEEVQAFFDQQKGRINAPFEQMKDRIVDYLKSTRKNEKRQQLIASLREKADVKVMLEPPRTEVTPDDAAYTLGEKTAPIVLVEFSDYQCPYSKKAQSTVRQVLDTYKDKIYYAFFDFPLAFHQNAMKAHEAARCAGEQGRYGEYNLKLFENQSNLGVEDLKRYAKELNVDTAAFDSCLDSGKASERIKQSIEKGNRIGVGGTPAFYINGIMLTGAQPFESFQEIVKAELARGGSPP